MKPLLVLLPIAKRFVSVLVYFMLLLWIPAKGQTKFNALTQRFETFKTQRSFNGIVVVAKNHNIIFQQAHGYASFEDSMLIDRSTPMPISSISKSFTALSMLILAERKQLRLDDPVKKYLRDFPYDEINLLHLLNHTSGFKRLYKSNLLTTQQVVDFVTSKKPRLSFQPGDKFQYSNLGYSLLSAVIEEVSNLSFKQFLDREILDPLGMNNTFLHTSESSDRIQAHSYDKKNKLKAWQLTAYPGAQAMYASADDLLIWDQALYSEQLASQESIHRAYESTRLNDGSIANYGLGWRKWNGSDHLQFHGGDWVGNESLLFRDLNDKLVIIILANRENQISKWQLMDEILEELGYEN